MGNLWTLRRYKWEAAEEADQAIQVMNKATLNGRVLVVFKEPETNTQIQGRGSST
jgi:hypothetical protein